MNIFFLSYNPAEAARFHCDKHVVKMILEYAQILSTVSRHVGFDIGYKPTHINHPSVVWARSSRSAFKYLSLLAAYLGWEYADRYGKDHKSSGVIRQIDLIEEEILPLLPSEGPRFPPQCMPEEYRNENTVIAYRQYYRKDKRRFATWKRLKSPDWMLQTDEDFEIEHRRSPPPTLIALR